MGCAVRLWPVPGPEGFWAPGSMTSWLNVNIELFVKSFVLEDLDGLYWAFGRAIHGGTQDANRAVRLRLQQAGAQTGLVEMSQPAYTDPSGIGDDGGLHAVGQVKVEVRNDFQPNPGIPN
jgi:hypothetical protein